MEIRVANESEKKLMDYICEYLGDSGVDLLYKKKIAMKILILIF